MTGLEKIIEQIHADSESICNSTLTEAEKAAAEIISEANAKAKEACSRESFQTEQKCRYIAERAKSGAELEKRRAHLAAKQELIAEMLKNSKDALIQLEDEKYFSLIFDMLRKYASGEKGEIAFNVRDLERLPGEFMSKVKKELGLKLELSKIPVNIDGGFVLLYGGIEENCSFSAIFSGESERLSDIASKILFKS